MENHTITKNWSVTPDGDNFFPRVFDSREDLPPGMYQILFRRDLGGIVFNKMNFNTQHLIAFPDAANQTVLDDIYSFWARKDRFEKFRFPYKRGILMHGPPGCGKTCTVAQVSQEIVKNGGYVIKFNDVGLFIQGMALLRKYHPHTPVVCIMEDLDRILRNNNVSEILNLLDGIGENIENILYLATTNEPDMLHNNIKNRPSRFDRRIEFSSPGSASRKIYLESLIKVGNERPDIQIQDLNIDMDQWVDKTDGLSFAHLKELFVSVICFERPFNEVVQELQVLNTESLEEYEEYEEPYDDQELDDPGAYVLGG